MEKKYTRQCPKCNETIFHSSAGSRYHCRTDVCRKCSDKNKSRANYGENNGKWMGYNGISQSYFNDVKRGAQRRNHIFDITIEDMWCQFDKQNKKCAYTGILMELPKRGKKYRKGTASLDRIDSTKGYTVKNIQWVHKDINWMKQDFNNSYFIKMCSLVSENKVNSIIETPIDIFIGRQQRELI